MFPAHTVWGCIFDKNWNSEFIEKCQKWLSSLFQTETLWWSHCILYYIWTHLLIYELKCVSHFSSTNYLNALSIWYSLVHNHGSNSTVIPTQQRMCLTSNPRLVSRGSGKCLTFQMRSRRRIMSYPGLSIFMVIIEMVSDWQWVGF